MGMLEIFLLVILLFPNLYTASIFAWVGHPFKGGSPSKNVPKIKYATKFLLPGLPSSWLSNTLILCRVGHPFKGDSPHKKLRNNNKTLIFLAGRKLLFAALAAFSLSNTLILCRVSHP
jgi:hypothetical protein